MDKESLLNLIHLYREKEALWNIHSTAFKGTEGKHQAVVEIAKEMKMSEDEVRKKIKSIRGTYVGEKTKVDKSKNTNKEYVSTLWWYNEMSFLDKCIIRRTTRLITEEKRLAMDIFDSFCNSINKQLLSLTKKDAHLVMEKIRNVLSNGNFGKLEKKTDENIELYETITNNDPFDSNESMEVIHEYTEQETINVSNLKSAISDYDDEKSNPHLIILPKLNEDYIVKLQPKDLRHTTKERKYKCPICEYAGTDRSNMLLHIQRHSKNKRYKCTICEKAFHTRTELNTHMRTHTGERPFLCMTCGRAFTTSSLLCKHVKRHNKVKEVECPICKKRFYELKNLREHINIHSDKRKFVCTECNATFKQRLCLKDHMKIHENKKAYKCNLCDARYNQRAGLYSHKKTFH